MLTLKNTFTSAILAAVCFAVKTSATPLIVGQIGLVGSGTLTTPDEAAYGGEGLSGMGLVWNATGTNGSDTVSISTSDINIGYTPLFDGANPVLDSFCFYVSGLDKVSLCNVNIDGISGWGEFHNIGGADGLLQIYDSPDQNTRNLLAQAEIVKTLIIVTGVEPNPHHSWGSVATFIVVDPPSEVPEPGTLLMTGMPLLIFVTARSAVNRRKSGR